VTGARPTVRGTLPGDPWSGAEIAVLAAGAGSLDVDGLLSEDRFEVRTSSSPITAAEVLDGPDCVVFGPDVPSAEPLELLSTLRERGASLPVVLAADVDDATAESLADRRLAALLPADAASVPTVLRGCVARLVDLDRLESLAGRALAAVEVSSEGFAFADPDGTFAFVTRAYAGRFGYEPGELRSRPWTACFPPGEASRLRSTALATAREGWQWVGGCVGQRNDGTTDTVRLRITGFDDGSLVFCVAPPGPAE
jgi:PAS domain S-box-containing protein